MKHLQIDPRKRSEYKMNADAKTARWNRQKKKRRNKKKRTWAGMRLAVSENNAKQNMQSEGYMYRAIADYIHALLL